jgi:hypothetical protein
MVMAVPSFVVDELETTGVTKTFKIVIIQLVEMGIGGVGGAGRAITLLSG